ncbi:MAG: hypothetical protein WEA58_08535 [Balneolaceae bacterium]
MFKLFLNINATLWWRSIKSSELLAMAIYGLFGLLIFGQLLIVAFAIMFAPSLESVQEMYPWVTPDAQYLMHLVFINVLWISHLTFTKISRLRLQDNQKFLAFGFPITKLSAYLNLAGFLQPVNLLFNLFWIVYLGLLATSTVNFIVVCLIILVNYGLFNAIKWRFKNILESKLKWLNFLLAGLIFAVIIARPYIDFNSFVGQPEVFVDQLLGWMEYTPAGLFYFMSVNLSTPAIIAGAISLLLGAIYFLYKDLAYKTRTALIMPLSTVPSDQKNSKFPFFKRMFGLQGGKFLYTVWSHSYTKTQILITFFISGIYIFLFNDGTAVGDFMVPVFLTIIPIMLLMLFMTNMFGFENRELLLMLQSPISNDGLVWHRIKAVLMSSLSSLLLITLAIPFFFDSMVTMVQIYLGFIFICTIFLHYLLLSSIKNYKKIKDVALMSVSNPVVPASVSFTGMFMVLLLGLVSFTVSDSFQWLHIAVLATVDSLLIYFFIRRISNMKFLFKTHVVPKLWNEL